MRPIETAKSDTTYAGVPSKGIGDLPTESTIELLPDGSIVNIHRSRWRLDDVEKAAIVLGGDLVLDVFGPSVPPIRLAISEPPASTPSAEIDRVLDLAIALSISLTLAMVGIEASAETVASWSDDERKEVGIWLRGWSGPPEGEGPPVAPEGPVPAVLAFAVSRGTEVEGGGEITELPERYRESWSKVAAEANRKRLRVEVRIRPGTETSTDDAGVLSGSFDLYGIERSGAPATKIGHVGTFDQAIAEFRTWLAAHPLPGPDALRDELKAFGQRLALLMPRDVAKKRGADLPIYRDFRDRILPLAWDNLVDATKVETLEDFVRRVGDLDAIDGETGIVARAGMLAAEARGLVPPKEEPDGSPEAE